jgi:hypothetical protein
MVATLPLSAWAAQPTIAEKSPLELTIEMPKSVWKQTERVPFVVTFRNTYIHKLSSGSEPYDEASARAAENVSQNLLLNVGRMLGNRAEMWSSLKIELKTESGEQVPVTLHWQVPGVGGRIYPLTVPLRAGSSYSLSINADDYLIKNANQPLMPGKYEIRLVYRGEQLGDGATLPPCWLGEAYSNTAHFEVLAD